MGFENEKFILVRMFWFFFNINWKKNWATKNLAETLKIKRSSPAGSW